MSARYLRNEVRLEGPRVFVSFDLEHQAGGEDFAVGYQLADEETGIVILDGPRTPAGPGSPARVEMSFDLPPEPGRYQVFVSPMREGRCWYYQRGWPFLLIEAAVEAEGARIVRARIVTWRQLRRENFRRSLGRALVYPGRTVWRNRSLVRAMVRRDVLGRYRGSFGGVFWTVLNPLLLMLTYFFVFGVVLETRFAGDPSRAGFALYFLAGMLPWIAFSEAAGRSPAVMLEHRNFVKKLVFPVETLPVNLVISGLITELLGLALFTAAFFFVRGGVPASVLWLPALIVPQVLFTAGVCWFLAALGVFVRDLGQIMGFALTLWFFITPICYPEASLPAWAAAVLSKNPIYVLVRGYRAVFLEGHAPAFGALWKLWALSAVVFVAGHAWFYRLRKSFADII
ncbi:MAG: ABC transporter permease [Bryobacteraceae bacterium]